MPAGGKIMFRKRGSVSEWVVAAVVCVLLLMLLVPARDTERHGRPKDSAYNLHLIAMGMSTYEGRKGPTHRGLTSTTAGGRS